MKVSICIPVYNMQETILRTIESALSQTYPNIEVLVTDNQSTDGTFEKASAIRDSRLRVVKNERNLGPYGNHNRGLELATGDWVKILHGDDSLMPECVEKMVKALEGYPPETSMVVCGGIDLGEKESEVKRTYLPRETFCMNPAPPRELIKWGNILGVPTMIMLHRKKTLSAGGFDLSLEPASDGDCWFMMRTRYPFVMMSEYLVYLRDDRKPPLAKRAKSAVLLTQIAFKQFAKWYQIERVTKEKPFHETPFFEALCKESFRFWDASFTFALRGYFALLKITIQNLNSWNVLGPSLLFYLKKRFLGKNIHSFTGTEWMDDLKHLIIQKKIIPEVICAKDSA